MDYWNTKTPSMQCRMDSTTLSQLAFPGISNPNFPWEKSHWDNTAVYFLFVSRLILIMYFAKAQSCRRWKHEWDSSAPQFHCDTFVCRVSRRFHRYHHHHHQSLNRDGRWGTTDDFATSFLHFSLSSTALWDLPNSRPVHSLMLSSHLFLCLPCLGEPSWDPSE